MTFEFFGFSNFEEILTITPTEYSGENLARYNIPMYYFSTTNTNNISHSVAGFLVGREIGTDSISFNTLEFKDRYFIGYNNDDRVYPGNFNMHPDSSVTMSLRAYVENQNTGFRYFDLVGPIIEWSLDNGVATFENSHPILILENPNIIKVHVGGIPDTLQVVLNGLPSGYNCSPENLFNLGYDAIPDTSKENTVLPINLSHIDSDTTRHSEMRYDFTRKFMAWIYSGGVTKRDSVSQRIKVDNVTSVNNLENELMPKDLKVYQNYPNPFNPSTTIKYELPEYTANLSIKIYDQIGNEVRTLSGDRSAGEHEVVWKGMNEHNEKVSSGVYFYRIIAGDKTESKKMIHLK